MKEVVIKGIVMVECACGCGTLIKSEDKFGFKRKYVKGHYNKGKKFSEDHRKKLSEAHKGEKSHMYGKHHSEETRRKIGEGNKGKIVSKKAREKISEAMKGKCGRKHTEESKLKMSKYRKGKCTGKNHPNYGKSLSEKTKKKLSDSQKGEKNHNWQDGISFGKYCHHFNEQYKEKIREYHGRVCFLCGKTEEDNGRLLDVHHVDYNKKCGCDDSMCKCVPLCRSCHGKTSSGNRDYWENKITSKLDTNLTWCEIYDLIPLSNFFK